MQAREYLEQVGDLKARIELKRKQLHSLRDTLIIGSAPMDSEQVTHSRNSDSIGGKLAAIVDTEREL